MHATRRDLLKATIPAAGALLIGETAIGVDVTRDDILAEIDALRANVVLYPGDSQVKADLITAIDNLRLLAATLPDPPPSGDPLEIVVNSGETRILEGTVAVTNIHVNAGGTLLVMPGAEVVWADLPLDPADTEQEGRGLTVEGTIRANGTARTRRLRLEGPLVAGDTTIEVQSDPIGWQVGDTLVLPDTRQKRTQKTIDPTSQSETVTVTAIAGRQVSITPTQFAHGSCALDPTLTPHVANIACDIVFRSANPAGTRAHAICLVGATVDLSHCEFRDMGRTNKSLPLDPATNRIGRYPLHLHQMGETDARVEGVVVRGSPGWGITVHGTNNAFVGHCVVYDIAGSGFMVEDGTERSTFADNFAVRIRNGRDPGSHGGVNQTPADTGFDGSGFWFRGPGNTVLGNVAADCQFAGYNWNGYYNGASWVTPGETRNNEGYNCNQLAWFTWSQSGAPDGVENFHPTVFEDFTGWHINGRGVESWHEAKHTFRRWRLLNDPAISSTSEGHANPDVRINTGMFFAVTAYENGGMAIEDCEIRGWNVGIDAPINLTGGGTFPITGTTLANYCNLLVRPHRLTTPRLMTLENVQLLPSGMTRPGGAGWATIPELDVWMRWSTAYIQGLDPVRLLDSGDSVYFREGAAPCATETPRIIGYVCEE